MSADQRRFYRCPLAGRRTTGNLVVRGRRLDCVVRDRSIGGFGIELAHDPVLNDCNVAILETAEGTFAVQIVRSSVADGRLLLGLAEIPESNSPSTISAGQIRGLSFALGAIAVVFLLATLVLAWRADDAARWFENSSFANGDWFAARKAVADAVLR